jgi:hypothetical protein
VEAFKFWAEKRGFGPKTGLKRQNRRGALDKLVPFFSAFFSWRPLQRRAVTRSNSRDFRLNAFEVGVNGRGEGLIPVATMPVCSTLAT